MTKALTWQGRLIKAGPDLLQGDSLTDALTCCREDVLIATKVAGPSGQMQWIRGGPRCLDAQNITEAIDGSLHRLQTDYIDLIQLHWPDRSGSCLTTTAAVTGPGHATASGAGLGAAEGASHPEGLPAATGAGGSCLEQPSSCCGPWHVVCRHHHSQQVLSPWLPSMLLAVFQAAQSECPCPCPAHGHPWAAA